MKKFLARYGDSLFLLAMVAAFAAAGVLVLNQHMISLAGWQTDVNLREVPLGDFRAVGDRDDVVPVDQPLFAPAAGVDWLTDTSPVIAVEVNGAARAYPLAVLVQHQVVNDTVGGRPLAITYCPLCNSAIAYDRRVGGQTLRFAVSGAVRKNGFIMWDTLTQSWWQQFTGVAVMGDYTGTMLTLVPSSVVSLAAFRAGYPQGQVLVGDARLSGYTYGLTPMAGYDSRMQPPYQSMAADPRLPAMERVLGVLIDGEAVAYPFSRLAAQQVVNDTVNGVPVVAFWQPGVVSPLDNIRIDRSRDVGMAVLFQRRQGGRVLTFYAREGRLYDHETGSGWTIFGKAVTGPLAGTRLAQTGAYANFWFAWAGAYPQTRVYGLCAAPPCDG
ncbi:MAG: DUF3179 domain-containing protein [Anaerolineae bacterium]|nr:DUF3179 domain-containing protein [Anaerolineae bacterium]